METMLGLAFLASALEAAAFVADGNTVREVGGNGVEIMVSNTGNAGSTGTAPGGRVSLYVGYDVSADDNDVDPIGGTGIRVEVYNSGDAAAGSGGEGVSVTVDGSITADDGVVEDASGSGIVVEVYNTGSAGSDSGGNVELAVNGRVSASGNTVRDATDHGVMVKVENTGADGDSGIAYVEFTGDVLTDGNTIDRVFGSTGIEVELTDMTASSPSSSGSLVEGIDDGIVVTVTDSTLGSSTIDINDNIINQVVGDAAVKLFVDGSDVGDVNVMRNEVDWDDEQNVSDPDAVRGIHVEFTGDSMADEVKVEGNKVDGGVTGVDVSFADGTQLGSTASVSGNEVKDIGTGVRVTSGTPAESQTVDVFSNTVTDSTTGIHIVTDNGGTITANVGGAGGNENTIDTATTGVWLQPVTGSMSVPGGADFPNNFFIDVTTDVVEP